ncbi:hypothetical protein LXL04_017247 [Taraxacum kok-saghyz]
MRINLPAGGHPTVVAFFDYAYSVAVASKNLNAANLYMYGEDQPKSGERTWNEFWFPTNKSSGWKAHREASSTSSVKYITSTGLKTPENFSTDITITGDGYISDDGIQVTTDKNETAKSYRQGRATYIRPLHLWDITSGGLASFTTYFSFVIDSDSEAYYGDGLTFFLAENNSEISAGSSMGLPITNSRSTHPFIAVEFDTFANPEWDPRNSSNDLIGDHVGISINSLTSVASQKWYSNVIGGGVCQAWIKYDSLSKNLSVSFTGFQNNIIVRQELHYIIDLKVVLPEWVIFGFSAATGNAFQKNTVKSWGFNSSDFQIDANNVLPPGTPTTTKNPVKGKNKTTLAFWFTAFFASFFHSFTASSEIACFILIETGQKMDKYFVGMRVEVVGHEEGFWNSYFGAIVLRVDRTKLRVRYEELIDENEEYIEEDVAMKHVRPYPPESREVNYRMNVGDDVDVYDREGWWRGEVVFVYDGELMVYFHYMAGDDTEDYGTFPLDRIRIHQEVKEVAKGFAWSHVKVTG